MELLSPAGSLEKLKLAILYGAKAVYLGGHQYSLRNSSDNFTLEEISEGVAFAHEHGALVYVVVNGFLMDEDFEGLSCFLLACEKLGVDAFIISDPGVLKVAGLLTRTPLHLSTQASAVNAESLLSYKELGISRVVLGREATLREAIDLKKKTGLEIEMFVHGSMCMAFSGHCVISNYTQGRDSNRGGCAHSCRFEYELEGQKHFYMSSKDLMGLTVLKEMVQAGIDSAKIEGRNKSGNYAAAVTKVYSEALQEIKDHGDIVSWDRFYQELNEFSHRDYFSGSLEDHADGSDSIYNKREAEELPLKIAAKILEEVSPKRFLAEVYSAFGPSMTVQFLKRKGQNLTTTLVAVETMSGNPLQRTRPGSLCYLTLMDDVDDYSLMRVES